MRPNPIIALAALAAIVSLALADSSAAAMPKLQLPFAKGATWRANGPHSDNGRTGPRNSVDLGPGGAGAATARAAAAGTAHVGTCNGGKYVSIDHGGGWSTRYRHLGSAAKIDGKRVSAGTVVGKTGLVCGNPTQFSHVHFALFKNGNPVALDGASIGGYTVHARSGQYLGYWTRNRDGATVLSVGSNGYAICCLTNDQSTGGSDENPRGNLDKVSSPAAGKVRVAGWAFDPSKKTAAVGIVAYVGGTSGARGARRYSLGRASRTRADVARKHEGVGSKHGFDATVTTSMRGRQKVCAYAVNIGAGSSKLLGCKTVTIKAATGSVAAGMPPPSAGTADVATGPGGELILAAVKKSGSLYTRSGLVGGGWNDFHLQGEPGSWSAAAVAIGSDGKYRMLAVKKSGALYYRIGTPGAGWSDFDRLGTADDWAPSVQPDLVAAPDGQLVLAAVKESGALYTRNARIGVGWGDFFKQGEVDNWASATVAIGSDGQSRLLAMKEGGDLYYRIGAGASWGEFERLGVAGSWAPTERPSLSAGPGGQLILVAIKKTGTLYTRAGQIGAGWSEFQRQGIENSWANVTVAVGSDGLRRLLATKKSGDLYYTVSSSDQSWGAFERFGVAGSWAPSAEPGLATGPGGELILAAVKKSGSLYTRSGLVGGGWNDFYGQGEADSWATFPPGG